jgi:hypothetical protein
MNLQFDVNSLSSILSLVPELAGGLLFSLLEWRMVLVCSEVSKEWNEHASSHALWAKLLSELISVDVIEVLSLSKNAKADFLRCTRRVPFEGKSRLSFWQKESLFKEVTDLKANKVCAHCETVGPTWLNVTWGLFACIQCVGMRIHCLSLLLTPQANIVMLEFTLRKLKVCI